MGNLGAYYCNCLYSAIYIQQTDKCGRNTYICVCTNHKIGYDHNQVGIRLLHAAIHATAGRSLEELCLPFAANSTVVIGGSTPNVGTDRRCQQLLAVIHNRGDHAALAIQCISCSISFHNVCLCSLGKGESFFCKRRYGEHFCRLFGGNSELLHANLIAKISPRRAGVHTVGHREVAHTVQSCKGACGKGVFLAGLGGDGHGRNSALADGLAVTFHLPTQIKIVQTCKVAVIFDAKASLFKIHVVHTAGTKHLLQLQHTRVETSVRIEQTVHAEVGVVDLIAQVAAVYKLGVPHRADINRVIQHLPYASAKEIVMTCSVI